MPYVGTETTENAVPDINQSHHQEGVTRIEIKNKWLRSWNLSYLRKTRGILRIVTAVFSLAAFIAEESTPHCHYGYNCVPPSYIPTYRYFAIVTMSTVILSIIMIIVNLNGHLRRVVLKQRLLCYIELSVLSVISFFLLFGIIFLIGQSGARISYQAAAALGAISLTAAEAHLILIGIHFKKFSKRKKKKARDGSLDNVRPSQRLSISEPVFLNGQEGQMKFNSIYSKCEEQIPNEEEPYLSSDSFDDSDEDNYPKQVTLTINRA